MLEITPSGDLLFVGPFREVLNKELSLKNVGEDELIFKVKTTAPRCYCVRPNSGKLQPGQSTTIHIMLQPFEYNENEKPKHKFMVQSLIPPKTDYDADIIWKSSANVHDVKLKCLFDAGDPEVVENGAKDSTVDDGAIETLVNADVAAASPQSIPYESAVDTKSPFAATLRATSTSSPQKKSSPTTDSPQKENTVMQQNIESLKAEIVRLKQEALIVSQQRKENSIRAPSAAASRPNVSFSELNKPEPFAMKPPLLYVVLALALFIGIILGRAIF